MDGECLVWPGEATASVLFGQGRKRRRGGGGGEGRKWYSGGLGENVEKISNLFLTLHQKSRKKKKKKSSPDRDGGDPQEFSLKEECLSLFLVFFKKKSRTLMGKSLLGERIRGILSFDYKCVWMAAND